MSAADPLVPASVASAPLAQDAGLPSWRRGLIVGGATLGLYSGFMGLYYATLPFFLLPISKEFGWGRGDVSAASVLAMLGMSLAAPFVGKWMDRFGTGRVILTSILLFALSVLSLRYLPPSLLVFSALSFGIGAVGAATSMAGYLSVLPRWFDQRLGMALGFAGIGLGLGVALNGWIGATLIERLGWRDAYAALAGIALAGGLVAMFLITPRVAVARELGARARHPAPVSTEVPQEGMSLYEALRSLRFWLLLVLIFLVTLSILGSAVHAPSLYSDHGLTPQHAGLGTALAGIGSMLARIATGFLLDRFFAPRVAAVVFVVGAAGLFLSSVGGSFPILLCGSLLAGLAIGAEGDLVPYLVRRYFGLKSFGVIFGCIFAAYSLAGLAGPVIFGVVFDRMGSYTGMLVVAGLFCLSSAVLVLLLGRYRYHAKVA